MRRALTEPSVATEVPRIHVVGVSTEQEPAPRVLVVENDPAARATFDSLLGTRWAVTLADRGDDARDRAQASSFDLVIANVEMPGMSGLDLARSLRANRATQDIPFILISRTVLQREAIAGLEPGADDFLVQPFSERELLMRVQTRLELTAMRRRNAQQEEILAGLTRKIHARDEFLSAASHELRTPITTLSLQTEGLLAADPSNGPSGRDQRSAAAASRRHPASGGSAQSAGRSAPGCLAVHRGAPRSAPRGGRSAGLGDRRHRSHARLGDQRGVTAPAPTAQRGGGALGPRPPRPGDHQPALERDQIRMRTSH